MKLIHWRKLIADAVSGKGDRLTDLALHMRDCERAKAILFAKGYGKPGITVAQLAALVPEQCAVDNVRKVMADRS